MKEAEAAPFRLNGTAAARDAERQLRSGLEAVRARLEEGDDELAKRDDQCVQLAQELDDARAEGGAPRRASRLDWRWPWRGGAHAAWCRGALDL